MKRKAIREHRSKTDAELKAELTKLELELETLRFGLAAGKVKNVRTLRLVRTSIAQIRTIRAENRRLSGGPR